MKSPYLAVFAHTKKRKSEIGYRLLLPRRPAPGVDRRPAQATLKDDLARLREQADGSAAAEAELRALRAQLADLLQQQEVCGTARCKISNT